MSLFGSPIWTFASAVAGLACLIVGVVGLVLARPRRPQFTYELVDFELNPKQRGKVGARAGDSRALIRIRNSGSATITPNDYVHPVRLHFQYVLCSHIHSARIVASSPVDIKELESLEIVPHVFTKGTDPITAPYDELVLPTMLLHPRETLTIEAWISPPSPLTIMLHTLLGTHAKPTVGVTGRVVNVTSFRAHAKGDSLRKLWKVAAIGVGIALLGTVIAQFIPLPIRVPAVAIPILFVCAICLLAIRWRLIWELCGAVLIFGFIWSLVLYIFLRLAGLRGTNDEPPQSSPSAK